MRKTAVGPDCVKTLLAAKARGTVDELYRYWMLGAAETERKPPRWSVVRDVLHWIE